MKSKIPIDPGLGIRHQERVKRLVNKDGTFNVYRQKNGRKIRGVYQTLVDMSWSRFLTLVTLAYFAVNILFACIYLLIGVENIQGFDQDNIPGKFLQAFYFSTQTITTVGYGALHPTGATANLAASVEALVGLLCFALATGLLYGRFSRPSALFVYSENALITPYKKVTSFQFQVANYRNNLLIEMDAKLMLTLLEPDKNGDTKRSYYNLKLERSSISFFPLNWTIVHPIDEDSPLFRQSPEDLMKFKAEFIILLKGFDDTFSQTVHSRHSYLYDEIVWNAKFRRPYYADHQGDIVLKLEEINLFEMAKK